MGFPQYVPVISIINIQAINKTITKFTAQNREASRRYKFPKSKIFSIYQLILFSVSASQKLYSCILMEKYLFLVSSKVPINSNNNNNKFADEPLLQFL